MNGIFQAAAEIQGFFETRQWQFAIIGEPELLEHLMRLRGELHNRG